MLKLQFQKLRGSTVRELLETEGTCEAALVQIYRLQIGKTGRTACFVSDGSYCVKGVFFDGAPIDLKKHEHAIIRIKDHSVALSKQKIGIVEFDVVCQYSKLLGQPLDIPSHQPNSQSDLLTTFIDPCGIVRIPNKEFQGTPTKKDQPLRTPMVDETKTVEKSERKSFSRLESYTVKKEENKDDKTFKLPPPKPLGNKASDYETIKGLWVGLKNWHLLCRLVKIDFQEFKKKKQDKLVQVLNIELIDISEVTISGAFFYEAALKFKDELKLNGIYKISQGTISNESYANSRNDKLSPFRLIFNVNSVFEEVSDVNIIANPEDSAITLAELLDKNMLGQEFSVIAILVKIEDPFELPKSQGKLVKQDWVVADPLRRVLISAVVWNDKVKSDATLVGRTVILSHFALNEYRNSLSLSSKIRSTIQPAAKHPYIQYEQQVISQHSSYDNLSQRQRETEGISQICQDTRELCKMVDSMQDGDTIRSDLNVWLNKMVMKKWYYDGCPHCNKVTEENNTCPHCQKFVNKTVPHFIMRVEISDPYGSIWSTAYDEFAGKIFKEDDLIQKLLRYDINQLKDLVENYYYQEYKLRVYTKKDKEGMVRHNIGKVIERLPEKAAQQNLESIRRLMGIVV